MDITGQKFGRLTAIKDTGKVDKNHLRIWQFQCDCGNLFEYPGSLVKRGRCSSCGCLRRDILIERNISNGHQININDRFGSLVVIKDLGFRQQASRDKRERWSLCQCDCGNLIEVRNNNLNTGMTQSCGCVKSRGERLIAQILRENDINFSTQYSFQDLRTDKNGILKFDFAIFKDNKLYKLIEFDGRQHTIGPDAKWAESSSLDTIKYRDNLKDEYCRKNNIILQRVPYTDIGSLSIDYLGLQELLI